MRSMRNQEDGAKYYENLLNNLADGVFDVVDIREVLEEQGYDQDPMEVDPDDVWNALQDSNDRPLSDVVYEVLDATAPGWSLKEHLTILSSSQVNPNHLDQGLWEGVTDWQQLINIIAFYTVETDLYELLEQRIQERNVEGQYVQYRDDQYTLSFYPACLWMKINLDHPLIDGVISADNHMVKLSIVDPPGYLVVEPLITREVQEDLDGDPMHVIYVKAKRVYTMNNLKSKRVRIWECMNLLKDERVITYIPAPEIVWELRAKEKRDGQQAEESKVQPVNP